MSYFFENVILSPIGDFRSASKGDNEVHSGPLGVLGGEGSCKLWGLLGDPWLPQCGVYEVSQLSLSNPETQILIEIGPR